MPGQARDGVLFTARGGTVLCASFLADDGGIELSLILVGRGSPMSLERWQEIAEQADGDLDAAAELAAREVGGVPCCVPVSLGAEARAQLEEAAWSAVPAS